MMTDADYQRMCLDQAQIWAAYGYPNQTDQWLTKANITGPQRDKLMADARVAQAEKLAEDETLG